MPKQYRLTKSADIKKVLKYGKKYRTPYFLLFVLKNRAEGQKFAFIASKKVGNAVQRNRAKRRLRNIVQKTIKNLSEKPFEAAFITFQGLPDADFSKLEENVLYVMKKGDILQT